MNTLLDNAQLIYLYDGTLEGLLSAIFTAFRNREYPANITEEKNLQESLLASPMPLLTDLEQAVRVQNAIVEKLGELNYYTIKQAFLADSTEKGGIILRFLQYAFRRGQYAGLDLAHPAVDALQQLARRVNKEAHYIKQFARFAELESGLFFARVEPKANVIPLIMEHFAARFNIQPFVIYDSNHHFAGIFNCEDWWFVEVEHRKAGKGETGTRTEINSPSSSPQHSPSFSPNASASTLGFKLPASSAAQDEYQALWQTFYDTIAIEERRNPTCQRNFMPKRFWGTMCEHIPKQLRKTETVCLTPSEAAKQPSQHLEEHSNKPNGLSAPYQHQGLAPCSTQH